MIDQFDKIKNKKLMQNMKKKMARPKKKRVAMDYAKSPDFQINLIVFL